MGKKKKKAQQCINTESTEKLIWKVILCLSIRKNNILIFVSFFPSCFPKISYHRVFKKQKKVCVTGGGGWKGTQEVTWSNSPAQAGSPRPGCPGLCLDSFWISLMNDSTKSLCQFLVILPVAKTWSLRAPPVFHFLSFAFWTSHCFYNSNLNLLMKLFVHQKPLEIPFTEEAQMLFGRTG